MRERGQLALVEGWLLSPDLRSYQGEHLDSSLLRRMLRRHKLRFQPGNMFFEAPNISHTSHQHLSKSEHIAPTVYAPPSHLHQALHTPRQLWHDFHKPGLLGRISAS